jgi:hypothetical protein
VAAASLETNACISRVFTSQAEYGNPSLAYEFRRAALACFNNPANAFSSSFLVVDSSKVTSDPYRSNIPDPNTFDTVALCGTILGHDSLLLLQNLRQIRVRSCHSIHNLYTLQYNTIRTYVTYMYVEGVLHDS